MTDQVSLDKAAVKLWHSYSQNTPKKLKLIDAYMGFILILGILQFIYCCVIGKHPFYAFLAGFSATVGSFVFAANLRIQVNKDNQAEFNISKERAFADFMFCSLIFYVFAVNFLG